MLIDPTTILAASDQTIISDPVAASAKTADDKFAKLLADNKDAADTLAEITKEGGKSYWAWKIKEMKKQITAQVMGDMNLTPDKIAQMGAKERLETENKIMKMVEDQLKVAINEEMKKKQKDLLTASASLQSVLHHAQGVSPKDFAPL